ncbi:MAG TPA: hypothetical protein VM638_03345 [Actinomycetota bacterium]|nr:hypothetical protein [Actinomycetota bacterium]
MMRRALRRRRGTEAFTSDALPDVASSQWWTSEQIAEYQARRICLIVEHAYEETRFYRERMRRLGLRPSSIQGPDDLRAIPPVDRAEVQASRESILVVRDVHEEALSGGTTGHRLRWARTIPWLELFTACLWRGFGWAGLDRGTKLVSFYSRMGMVSGNSVIIEKAFELDTVEDDIRLIEESGAEVAYVYASAAYLLGRYLLETGRTLPLKSVITSCETLYDEQRAVIERAFGAEVFDNYGCNDGGAWGAECTEHDGLHQDVERAVVEFVDGRMVSTDLWNTAFPFIRYANGDAGEWVPGACACGRSSPRMKLAGRVADLLVTPVRTIFPSTLNFAFLKPWIRDARAIQRSALDVEVLVAPEGAATPTDLAGLEEELAGLFEGMRVSLRVVETIPPTLSGKHRIGINLADVDPLPAPSPAPAGA